MSREAPFQDRLRDIIQNVISKFKFDGLAFSTVERGFKIDNRESGVATVCGYFVEGRGYFFGVDFDQAEEEVRQKLRLLNTYF